MKTTHLLSIIFLTLSFTSASAQSELNSFFRTHYNLEFSMSTNSWNKMSNVRAYKDGPTLSLKFEMPAHDNIPIYYYTVKIDLRNTSIYNGYWRESGDQYGRTVYYQSGDKAVLNFKGDLLYSADIPAYITNDPSTSTLRMFNIRCLNSSDADKLVECFLAAQKGYREPDGWEVYRKKQVEISNNPYSGLSSKEIFDKIKSTFGEYEVKAVLGYYTIADIKNMKISFVYPNLKFNFTTPRTSDGLPSTSSDKLGNVELSCPVQSTTVENNYGTIVFASTKGLEYILNGSKTVIGDYAFKVSSYIGEDLTAAIQQFFKAIIREGYTGSYGTSAKKPVSSTTNKQTEKKTISNKYEN